MTLKGIDSRFRRLVKLACDLNGCADHCASGARGSVLIGLVITMVIFAALGAAMLPMTNTSTLSQVGANLKARAYSLAESGYLYAAGEYKNASGASAKDNMLDTLHTQGTYTLQNNAGQFELEIYPFYFKTRIDPNGTQVLSTEVNGGFYPDLSLSTGRLRVDSNFYDYTSISQSGSDVDFTTVQVLPSITVGTDVLSVGVSTNVAQVIPNNGDLDLQGGYINAFPQRNGSFNVDGKVYSYQERDEANNKLLGVQDPTDPAMVSFNVGASSDIVLEKFIKVHSTGTYGQGPTAVSRLIRYHVPLSLPELDTEVEFHETFDDLSKWSSAEGSQAIESIGGDNALRITATTGVGAIWSQTNLDWQSTAVDLDSTKTRSGGFLSYDSQVKIGFVGTPAPDWGFNPSPIPLYYMAGISFRVDGDDNNYGLSFQRGSSSTWPTPDNIENEYIPLDQRNLIVLWQNTNFGADRAWLAYKYFSYYAENVENGTNGWTTGGSNPGLWHITNNRSESPDNAWHYGRGAPDWDYDVGINDGWLMSPPIDLSVCPLVNARLRFWSWYATEEPVTGRVGFDEKKVQISNTGGASWSDLYVYSWPANLDQTWEHLEFNLGGYIGQTVLIRFLFSTNDANNNDYEGWYIDDVTIGDFPQESTLMVRVQEAASITFDTGGSATPVDGDTVIGQTSGAFGKIHRDPMLSSGAWASSDAAGTMTINNLNGVFIVGETVTATASTTQVTVLGFSARDNYIRALYGYPDACGTASSQYLDEDKLANPRNVPPLNWAPDNVSQWEAANDYFRLVQWDGFNTALGTMQVVNSIDEPDAVIRSWEPELLTSPIGPFNDIELGLHASGKGALNTYFDDFGLKAVIGRGSGTLPPIQE